MAEKKYEKKVIIRDIVKYFGFEQITGNDESLDRWVVVPDLNRPGFELSGFYRMTEPRRIVVLGNKEINFIKEMSEEEQRERFAKITDPYTPMIIIARNRECPPILKEVAASTNFPIFRTSSETYRLTVDLITYLDETLAPDDTIGGVLVAVYGKGVLLIGESGMGKSEVALELIKDHQVLVADDRVDVQRVHNNIVGHSPELLKGMLEVRGIGIIDVAKMFGASSVEEKFKIDFIIHLVKFDRNQSYDRLGNAAEEITEILDVRIPTMVLPVSEGRNMGVLVEAAVTNFVLKENGFNSGKEFHKRYSEFVKKNSQLKDE